MLTCITAYSKQDRIEGRTSLFASSRSTGSSPVWTTDWLDELSPAPWTSYHGGRWTKSARHLRDTSATSANVWQTLSQGWHAVAHVKKASSLASRWDNIERLIYNWAWAGPAKKDPGQSAEWRNSGLVLYNNIGITVFLGGKSVSLRRNIFKLKLIWDKSIKTSIFKVAFK